METPGKGPKKNVKKSNSMKADTSKNLVKNFDEFQGLKKDEVKAMIAGGKVLEVVDNLEKFEGLDGEILLQLINSDRLKFLHKSHDELVQLISSYGKETSGGDTYFPLSEEQGEALSMRRKRPLNGFVAHLSAMAQSRENRSKRLDVHNRLNRNINKFSNLDGKVAMEMINLGYGDIVGDNLENFEGLNYQEIAENLIEKGEGYVVVKNLENFEGVNHKRIAKKLIEKGRGDAVVNNLEKFEGLDYQEIAESIIETFTDRMVESGAYLVIENLDKFEGIDRLKLADIIAANYGLELLLRNQDKFEGLNCNRIAKISIEKKGNDGVFDLSWCLDYREKNGYVIKGLDKEVAGVLIDKMCGLSVVNNLVCFEGLDSETVAKLKRHRLGKVAKEFPERFGLNKKK